ncbi:MAG: Crp/Fnr family transcriptional regulator [Bacteroidales bacterium]
MSSNEPNKREYNTINIESNCFTSLPQEIQDEMRNHKKKIQFKKGEILLKQGTFSSSIMIIFDGLIKEYIEGPNNKCTNLRILTQGDILALSGLFSNRINNYSAMALTDVTVCVIEREYLIRLIEENPQFGLQLVKRYSLMENNFFALLHNQLYKQMNGKVADTILYLTSGIFDTQFLFANFSRKDLAEFASITPENTIRVLKKFESEGIIRLNDKQIEVIDRESLIRISQIG